MLSSKLGHIFLSLSGYERAALRHFVYSPYHNRREDVCRLFDYLQVQAQNLNNANWQQEHIFFKVYPDEKIYDKGKMRYLMSFLLATIEDFLIAEACQNDQSLRNKLLMAAYRQHQLPDQLEYVHQRATQQLEKQPLRDPEYWNYLFHLEDTAHYLHQTTGREKILSLQPLHEYLNTQYIAQYFRLACLMHAQQAVSKIEYQTDLLPDVLKFVENNPEVLQQVAVSLYYHYYQAITQAEPSESRRFFTIFRAQLLEATHSFRNDDMRDLYYLAINYGIRRINSELGLLRETFDLYLAGLQHGFLLENGKLHRFAFKNIIALALHLKEFDWAHEFIDTHGALLHNEYQQTYIHYCRSKLFFTQKNYSEAMERLQQIEYEDIYLNIDAKIMLLKIYYELHEHEVLDSYLSTLRVFLNRKKKLLGYHVENYKNIIRAVHSLLQVNPYSRTEIEKLRLKIQQMKILTERPWLLQQVDLLMKN
jgi:hypothetical protein